MSAPRRKLTLKVQLAATLCALNDLVGNRLIPHADAKMMTADQVISLFQFHHYPIPHEAGGPDEHWNLEPMLILGHRKVTAKETIPAKAKGDRLRASEARHRAVMAAKIGRTETAPLIQGSEQSRRKIKAKRQIPSRPFQKGHRPLRSRNNLRRRKP